MGNPADSGREPLTEPLRSAQRLVTRHADTLIDVRRTVVIWASLVALAVPVAALAVTRSPGDGTLVVQNGSAPKGTPVVTLVIQGAAIGRISGNGKVIIEDPTPGDLASPEVNGFTTHRVSDSGAEIWTVVVPPGAASSDFRFRAVGGTYRITIYGTGVDLVASGHGTVVLAGSPDMPTQDGKYSLNGDPFRSLPASPSKQLAIGISPSATG